jgi:hypothetical protein
MKKILLAGVAVLGLLAFSETTALSCPGTGTPGYWQNHPDTWPVQEITIGGVTYTKEQAIAIFATPVAKDKRNTMFPALVSAKLNVLIGNESSCIAETIQCADDWMAAFGNCLVRANSDAWCLGEPLYCQLDAYNNGLLCAPHRDSVIGDQSSAISLLPSAD